MNRHDIGRRIEAYRDRLNMSTLDLAERIKRSQATISRIENGKQGLTFELLNAIAAELRIHPFALLSDEPLRHSVLLPADHGKDGGYAPNLLANAIQAGRQKRRLRIDTAAGLLGVSPSELEAIELALSAPEEDLLDRICDLYGLDPEEMRVIRRFSNDAPNFARGLAHLQQIFSHMYHMLQRMEKGEEAKLLAKFTELLESVDTDCPLAPDSSSEDIGLFLNRLSLHLVNALRDDEFRGRMFQMAKASQDPAPAEESVPNP